MSTPVEFAVGDQVRQVNTDMYGHVVPGRLGAGRTWVMWRGENTPSLIDTDLLVLVQRATPDDAPDMVNHPPHYTSHPAGVECIDVVEHMPYNVGAAMKYLWREGLKGDGAAQVEDLRKAAWYATREADRLERARADAFLAPSAKGAEGWQQ